MEAKILEEAQKWLILETIDQAWKQHMVNLDNLKEGINLRGWGQKNPLIEYKRESFILFEDMMRNVYIDIIKHIFNLNPEQMNTNQIEAKRIKELEEINLISGEQESSSNTTIINSDKIGRNEPCSCNSGKKYKKCCGLK